MCKLKQKKFVQKCALFMVLCSVMFTSGCSLINAPVGVFSPDSPSSSPSSLPDESEERLYPQSDEDEHRFDMGEDSLEVSIQINEMQIFPAGSSKNPSNQNLLLVFCSISNYTDESIHPYVEWLDHTHVYFDNEEISPEAVNTVDITSLTSGAGEILESRTMGDYAIPFWLPDSSELSYSSTLSVLFEDTVNSMRTTFRGGEFPVVADSIVE